MRAYLNKQLLLNIFIIILLNIVASFFFFRIDLTEEKRHSLNDTTKDVVSSLDDIAYVKVYLDGDLPSGFIRLKNSTKDILDEFRNYSSLIEYEFINTNDFSSIDERNKLYTELSENGLEPTNLQVQENNGNSEQIIFPGAIVYYKGRSQSLNLLQNQIGTNPENVLNNSIEDIEFELTNALFKLMNNNKPSIAFLEGNNELNELETADISHSLGQVKGSLSEYFNVQRFNIKDYELEANGSPSLINQLNRLNKFEAIIIAKPTQKFTKVDKFLIDQYIMNGGKTIWFIDGVIMDMDSLKGNAPYSMAIPNDLNLTDMLFKYGLRVNYDLVMDFQADNIPIIVGYQGDVPQQQLLPWLYHPIFIPKSKHPIVKNIDGIKSSFVSSVDTVSAKNIKKTPLLFSSPYSKLPKAPHRVSLNILEQNPSIEQYNHGKIPVGYLLEGKFESVFTNRLAPNDDKLKPLNQSKANKMIVFGDGDLIKNHVNSSGLSYPLGYNHYSNTQYLGNKRMIVNALNYILGNNNIINIRAKEINLRLLNKKEIKENKLKWQLINTLLPIFIMSIIISLLLLRRKRQYR
ncbi:MAG: gliding motility-associated ABC transporter substrate-binding protein GldG [Flavobacteriales bacterium]|nr:gliding motility-associated ABC transporter substrate-binding protein GldG [Flavobacteriales bacterium]